MNRSSLFGRLLAPRKSRTAGRDGARRGGDGLHAILEELEQRRVLAVSYLGVTHGFGVPGDQPYTYEVSVTKSGPADSGELWMRYNQQFNRIDFDTNSGFTNTTNFPFIAPVSKTIPSAAPFSVPAINTVIATWNGPVQNFRSSSINIVGGPGTTVRVANGDALPLGLRVSLSSSVASPSAVLLEGPINTTPNAAWATGVTLTANSVTTSAAITAAGVSLNARDGVQLRNTINSGVTARVSDGDFQLIAGATINGDLGVFMGLKDANPNKVGYNGVGGDILIDGTVNAGSVTLQTNSSVQATSIVSGPSGIISGGGSLSLFNAGLDGGKIDVRTRNFSVTNVDVGVPSNTNPPPDIGISIDQQAGNLAVNAVPSSRGQISLKASAAGARILVNSDIKTEAGLALDASDLQVTSPLTTTAGNIELSGDTVTIGGFVTAGAGGVGNIAITSRKGAVSVNSAAVVQAPGEQITIQAATDVTSQARITARQISLNAGGAITIAANADEIVAAAGKGITVTDPDDLAVLSATTQSGPVAITAGGFLAINSAGVQGTGSATLDGAGGVLLDNLRVQNGSAKIASSGGSVRVRGTVAVPGADADLSVSSSTGNVIIDSSADVSVNDQLAVAAPLGRVLTPGTITAVRVDTTGSGYTSPPTVTLDAGGGGAAAAAVANQGVAGFRITSGGSGYVTPPTVNLIGGGGTNAKATASISATGAVIGITVTNPGIGYTSAPTVTFSGGSGSGATADALLNGVSSVIVSNPGSGYLVPPEVTISSGAGAVASPVTTNAGGGIQSINVSAGGSDYGVAPTVSIVDSSNAGFGAAATANLATGVSTYTMTSQGAGYTAAPGVTFSNAPGDSSPGGAAAVALISGSVTGVTLTGGGTDYLPNPGVQFVGDGSGATATATIDGSVVSTVLGTGGNGFSGTGYSAVPTVSFSTPEKAGGVTAQASAFLGISPNSLSISYPSPAYPGQPLAQYSIAPTITFKAPAGGQAAAGVVRLDANGVVNGVDISDAGWGYTTFTNADFTWGGGTVKNAAVGPAFPIFTANSNFFTVSRLDVTNPGSGYRNHPTISFSAGNAQATAEVRGPIDSVTPGAGGTGYTSAPQVIFVDGSGSGATATTTMQAKVIALSITSPGRYKLAPTVSFTPAPGDVTGGGAAATVGVSNYVSGITVTNPGTGYNPATTTVSLKAVAGGAGAVCGAISVDAAGAIIGVNLGTGGEDYVTPPTVTLNDTSGSGKGAVVEAVVTAGKVTGFTILDPGSGYDPAKTVVSITSAGSGAKAVANLDSAGSISSITVTSAGSGYLPSAPPTVRITPYGRTATGTAAIGPGQVTGIRVDAGGSGYATAPTVTITGNGSGATAIANVVGGVVTGIVVTNMGSGYTGTVGVTISGGGGSGAGATALVGGVSTATVPIDNNAGYANYAALPRVTFSGGGATTQATGTAIISNIAQLAAKRLSWTAIEAPLDAVTSSFNRLAVNLTGVNLQGNGDLVLRSTSALTLEGGSTVDGSIIVAAPSLTVAADLVVGDASSKRNRIVDLTATSGDLTVSGNVGTLLPGTLNRTPLAQKISLTALQGGISAGAPALLTTNDVVFTANKSVNLRTSARTVTGSVSDSTAGITILQNANDPAGNPLALEVPFIVAAGGPVKIESSAAPLTIGRINAGDGGTITLAGGTIGQNVADAAADLVAAAVTLTAQSGAIDLETATATLTASAPLSGIRVTNVAADGSTPVLPLTVSEATALNDITISSAAGVTATKVTSTGGRIVTLTAAGAASDVKLGAVTSTKGVVGVTAGRDIVAADPLSTAASVVTGNLRLAAGGKVSLRTNVDSVAGTAGGDLTLSEASDISLGEPQNPSFQALISTGGNVAVTTVGTISASNVQATALAGEVALTSTNASVQMGTVVASAVKVSAKGDVTDIPGGIISTPALSVVAQGKQVSLGTNANQIGTVDVNAGTGVVAIRDVASDLRLGAITGGSVTIAAEGGGGVTQLAGAAVKASTRLSVTSKDGGVTLDNVGNDVAGLSIVAAGQPVAYTDSSGFDVAGAGLVGSTITLKAAGAVTQTAGITGGTLAIQGNGGPITLNTVANDVAQLTVDNAAGNVFFYDSTGGLDLGGITGGSVAFTVIGGALTQSAPLTASVLQVASFSGAAVSLGSQNNSIGVFAAYASGPVSVKDTVGDLVLAGIDGYDGTPTKLSVDIAGGLYQSLPIKAGAVVVKGSGAPIVLDAQKNLTGSFTATNGTGWVSFLDAADGLDVGGIAAGPLTLSVTGPLSQSGAITASSLSITGSGGSILLDTKANVIDSLAVVNKGGWVSVLDTAGDLVIAGVTAGDMAVVTSGSLTQSAPIVVNSLGFSANGPNVRLDNPANLVNVLGGANVGGDVAFVNAGNLSAGPITAGMAGASNGNLSLTALAGNLNVVGNLTAQQDQITLDARNGTILFAPGVALDGDILVYYYDPNQPAPVLPATVPSIVAQNGNLSIVNPAADNTVLANGYAATGDISIVSNTGFTLSGLLRTTGVGRSVQLIATSGSITFAGNGGIDNAPALGGTTLVQALGGTVSGGAANAVSGGTTTLSAGQGIALPGAIAANSLSAAGGGAAVSLAGSNRIGTFTAINAGGTVSVSDTDGTLVLAGVAGSAVTVNAFGPVTQSAPINSPTVTVNGNGGTISLDTQPNAFGQLAATNIGGTVSVWSTASSLDLAGVNVGSLVVTASGPVTQSAPVSAGGLVISGAGSAITLDSPQNYVGGVVVNNGAGGFSLTTTAPGLVLAGVTAGGVTVKSAGGVSQSAPITATSLSVTGAGTIALDTQNNVLGSFTATNGANAVGVKDSKGDLALGVIQGGAVAVTASGAVSQTGPITATTLAVTGVGSPINLGTQANVIGTFSATNGTGAVTIRDSAGGLNLGNITSGALTVNAAGNLAVNQTRVVASGPATITTTGGGTLTVTGPQTGGLVSSSGVLSLAGVQGAIALVSGGLVQGQSIVGNKLPIQVGGTIATTAELNSAVGQINKLPVIAGSPYELVVGANLTLTQTLSFTRAVSLRGASAAARLTGSAAVTNGLVLGATAGGSRITNLAFAGFAGTAIQMNAVQNAAVSGVTVTGTGGNSIGIGFTGISNGTTVRGNSFTSVGTGASIVSATGLVFGGTGTGQGNTITSAARAGVFASGVCTGSSVVKTRFVTTTQPYNVSGSRGLSIVN